MSADEVEQKDSPDQPTSGKGEDQAGHEIDPCDGGAEVPVDDGPDSFVDLGQRAGKDDEDCHRQQGDGEFEGRKEFEDFIQSEPIP